MVQLPDLDSEKIRRSLKAIHRNMSLLQMQARSGVDRQVLYRVMGGSSIQRSPYEIVQKIVAFIDGQKFEKEVPGSVESPVLQASAVTITEEQPKNLVHESQQPDRVTPHSSQATELPPLLNTDVLHEI